MDIKSEVEDKVKGSVEKGEQKLAESQSFLTEIIEELKNKAAKAKENTAEYVDEGCAKIKDRSVELEGSIRTYIENNPWKSIGFSVVAGLILAKFMSKK